MGSCTHFELRLAETNRLYQTNIRPGTFLIEKIDVMSRQFGYKKIILDSVQNRVSYYEKLGYVKDGDANIYDPNYGELTPMTKWL